MGQPYQSGLKSSEAAFFQLFLPSVIIYLQQVDVDIIFQVY